MTPKTTTVPRDLADWLSSNDQRLHEDLFEFLRIPSVSARSEHNADTARAAAWLHVKLERIGFTTVTHATAGHPIVLAEWRGAPKGAPTVLVYGHYDVQPPEPLELWTSPAFEPAIRDGNIYARGSVDDKGQLWAHVAALEAHLAVRKTLPFDEAEFKRHLDVAALGGEPGYTTLEKLWTRPTCEVNGMLSGYTGEGAKTVLPGTAMVKVSCRLVPDQDPVAIAKALERHVMAVAPKGVRVKVTTLHGGHPWRADLAGPLYESASRALEAAFGRTPVITGEGGSIPVVNDFARILGAPVLLVGFGLPGENAHAPDEWISQDNFRRGMRALATLWDELGAHGV